MLTKRELTEQERFAVASLYETGVGTIHGFAALYDVAISTVKAALDEYGVEHDKLTGRHHRNLAMGERPIVQMIRALDPRPLTRRGRLGAIGAMIAGKVASDGTA